ncbi:hypothetical protein FB451DRAFT_1478562, partial [Mycena latifolia]
PSKSDPAKVYEVDIETYTCTCLDYPLISFCKHICAVQDLFEEHGNPLDGVRASPKVPALSSLQAHQPIPETSPISAKPQLLTVVAEKLERLAARIRRPRQKEFATLADLDEALDDALLQTDNGTVLPSSQYVEPNTSTDWKRTRGQMMPGIKTKRQPAGDPAYGGRAASGSKAKRAKLSQPAVPRPTLLPASLAPSHLTPANIPVATPPTMHPVPPHYTYYPTAMNTSASIPNPAYYPYYSPNYPTYYSTGPV